MLQRQQAVVEHPVYGGFHSQILCYAAERS